MNQFKPCAECTTPDVCRRGGACGREMLAQASGLQRLAAFGAAVLQAHRDVCGPHDLDAGHLQELAEKAGVLVQRTVTEPCGESCDCAGDLPARCFFVADDVRPLIKG